MTNAVDFQRKAIASYRVLLDEWCAAGLDAAECYRLLDGAWPLPPRLAKRITPPRASEAPRQCAHPSIRRYQRRCGNAWRLLGCVRDSIDGDMLGAVSWLIEFATLIVRVM